MLRKGYMRNLSSQRGASSQVGLSSKTLSSQSKRAARRSRFYQAASKIEMELLEQRVMLSVSPAISNNPVPPPPLPSQPEPLQGVVGTPFSLDPQLVNDAYGFNSLEYNISGKILPADGADQTIAIVDAYGSPSIVQDAQTFDEHWGISNYDSGGNFFLSIQKLNPTVSSESDPVDVQQGWAKETALDVEWAHAVAPGAHILLVEAPSQSFLDLLDAAVYGANQKGVVAVSMSFGFPVNQLTEPATGDGFLVTPNGHTDADGITNAGVVFVAASGDTSGVLNYPSASLNVLSVGGETVTVGLNGVVQNLKAWSGSGGGTDTIYSSPQYHVPEVALDADPLTGVWVYDSQPDPDVGDTTGGWSVVGGTSFSCPAWAGVVAIIDQGLQYRSIPSLTTDQFLGFTPYDERGTTAPGDQVGTPSSDYGVLGLAEGSPETYGDLSSLTVPGPDPNTFPLWNHTNGPIPDITKTPDNGSTGWGAPNEFNGASPRGGFIQDMVGSNGITISAGALDYLGVTEQPQNVTAGATISPVQITVFSPATDNPDSTFNGNISVQLLEAGTLLGTTTLHVTNGVATFSDLSIDAIGTYEIEATSEGVTPVTTLALNVSPAPATKVVIVQQPQSIYEFNSMLNPIIVDLEDQFGDLVAGSGVPVTLSILTGPPGATLTGQTSATTVNGVAMFSKVSASEIGGYTLQVSSPGVTSATTSAFAVVAIPTLQRHLFNAISLSPQALLFQETRISKTLPPTPPANSIAATIAGDIQPSVVASVAAPAAAAPAASFAAASTSTGSSGADSQLLDNGTGNDKKILN
jgi:hypothetical protein